MREAGEGRGVREVGRWGGRRGWRCSVREKRRGGRSELGSELDEDLDLWIVEHILY